jgi:hypothetical protein
MNTPRLSVVASAVLALCFGTASCGSSSGSSLASTGDAGTMDAGGMDAGEMDSSRIDSGMTPPMPPAPPPTPPTWAGGSRLKLVYDDGGGGALSYVGVMDTTTQLKCSFLPTSDGTLRCLPEGWGGYVFFADPACTQPVVSAQQGCLPRYVTHVSAQLTCDGEGVAHVYESDGSPSLPSTATLYATGISGCSMFGQVGPGTANPAREVDPTMFVAGTTRVIDGGGKLGLDVLTADDGTTILQGLIDRKRNTPCTAEQHITLHDDIAGCLPLPIAYAVPAYYTDAACTQPFATIGASTAGPCVAQAAIFHPPPDATNCSGGGFSLREIGAPVSPAMTYSFWNGVCTSMGALSSAVSAYALGATIPSTDLPSFASASLGSGRLHAVYRASVSGALLEALRFEDTAQANTPCQPAVAPDGHTRCIPDYAIMTVAGVPGDMNYYTDAACTHLVVDLGGTVSCPPPLPVLAAALSAADCAAQSITELRQVTGLPRAIDVYEMNGSTCTARPHIDGEWYADVGDVVDPTIFAEVARVER